MELLMLICPLVLGVISSFVIDFDDKKDEINL